MLGGVLLTNTVPFKPPGNKAYSSAVKERFRPFLAELLVQHWQGDRVITLGTEAFQWFAPYETEPGAFDAFWKREDRYEAEIPCTIELHDAVSRATKRSDHHAAAAPVAAQSALVQPLSGLARSAAGRRHSSTELVTDPA